MMIFFLTFFSLLVQASQPEYWATTLQIVEKHEFYKNNEVIGKPAGTWQTLFALIYPDSHLRLIKECVFYKIPAAENGILKVKKMSPHEKCENSLLSQGDNEWPDIIALQYFLEGNRLSLNMTFDKYKSEKWIYTFVNYFSPPAPKKLLSSAEFKTPKLIMLGPASTQKIDFPKIATKPQKNCHQISDDCEELSPSSCAQCPEGWYEIPNGCPNGPKYCGVLECGGKNQPACRRGMRYQRIEKKYECRTDNSFAYCSTGLNVVCEGSLAYCR